MQPFIVFQIISRDAFHKTLPKILYGDGTILRDKYLLVWNIYWWYLFLRDHNSSMLSQIFINHFILQIFPIMCAHVTTSVSKRFKENGFTRNFFCIYWSYKRIILRHFYSLKKFKFYIYRVWWLSAAADDLSSWALKYIFFSENH